MNRQIFSLAHEITRNTVRHGDCYRTTFGAALKVARALVESIHQAIAVFAEMETAPTRFHIPGIAARAGKICNAASRSLWGAWNSAGYRQASLCAHLEDALFEVYVAATVGDAYKEAWEMLVCVLDDFDGEAAADRSAAA